MDKIGIMTDTNSGLTAELAKQHDVWLLSMPILVNGREYFENADISQAEFFTALEGGATVSTSQPAPGNLLNMWDEALKTCDELIYIPMSSALSSACESAQLFARDYHGRVHVIDNRRISVSQKQSVLEADRWRREGLSAEDICNRLNASALDASIYISVSDLNYLKRGGRITPAVATIGTVLSIKPILQIQGGKLDAYKKVRGNIAARNALIDALSRDLDDRFAHRPYRLYIAYAGAPELGKEWQHYVQSKFPDHTVYMDPLPLSIACHTGPGTIGVGVVACPE